MPGKIALIDVEEDLLEANRALLQSYGHEVRTATDGASGLQLVEEMRPDIVVLELVLPKLHGLQLCAAIRKQPDLRDTKILIAASSTYKVDVRKARDLGAASFLNKPYAPEALAQAIKSLESVPIPPNEARRVATLKAFEILDTPPEQAFDDLTRLTAIVCEAPGALITFVDTDRLWYKSKIGLVADEVPRELSFCAHAIMYQEVMVVEDATKDARFAGNPLVNAAVDPIRFYAGSPLVASTGDALGSVCVIGHEPRTMTDLQKNALRLIAKQVQVLLEWRRYVISGKSASAQA